MATQLDLLQRAFNDVISLREGFVESAQAAQRKGNFKDRWYFQGKADLADSLVAYLGELLREECDRGE